MQPFRLTNATLRFPDALGLPKNLAKLIVKGLTHLTKIAADDPMADMVVSVTVDFLDVFCDCINLLNVDHMDACRRYLFDTLQPELNIFDAFGLYSEKCDALPEKLANIMADLFRMVMVRMTETCKDAAAVSTVIKADYYTRFLRSMQAFITVDLND